MIYDYEIRVFNAFQGKAVAVKCLQCDDYVTMSWKGATPDGVFQDFLRHLHAKHPK